MIDYSKQLKEADDHDFDILTDLLAEESKGLRTGRTSQQIRNAPQDAFYVTLRRQHTLYCQKLAYDLGREDMTFYSLEEIFPRNEPICGPRS